MNRKLILTALVAGFFTFAAQASNPLTIVSGKSPEAGQYSKLKKLSAKLPDKGTAQLAVDASGTPQALLLPGAASVSVRDQLLKYGAALNPDGSMELPLTTGKDAAINVIVATDGSASIN